jgi:hypothetical protein
MRFSGTFSAETTQPTKMKLRTIDDVGKISDVPKMVPIGYLEAAPKIGEI